MNVNREDEALLDQFVERTRHVGLTELTDATGISRATIHAYRQGKRPALQAPTRSKILDYLGAVPDTDPGRAAGIREAIDFVRARLDELESKLPPE